MKRFLLLSLLALVVAGCGSSRAIVSSRVTAVNGLATLDSTFFARRTAIKTFTGDAVIAVRSPQQDRSVGVTLRIARPDSVYLKLAAFGLTVGEGLATPDSVFVYNRIQNELTLGGYTPEAVSRLLGVPVAFADLIDLLTGLAAPPVDPRALLTLGRDSTITVVYPAARADSTTRRYTLDRRTLAVRSLVLSRADSTILTATFSEFDEPQPGVILPRQIRLDAPGRQTRVDVTYTSVELNRRPLRLQPRIPDDAHRIERTF